MAKKFKAPEEIWAYVCETDSDGEPIWCLAKDLDGIPDDYSGEKVAKYKLTRTATFFTTREVK